ncbi:adenylate cyclase type 10-like [Porphyrio hochstetteri]
MGAVSLCPASAVRTSALAATSSCRAETGGRVCTVKPHVNLENPMLPTSLKEIALAQLDQRRPLEQVILRFAAVIGQVFTTQLLYHILPRGIRKEMSSILDMLTNDKILMWLERREAPHDVQDATTGPANFLQAERGRCYQ